MGDRLGRSSDHRRYAVQEQVLKDPEPSAARAEALTDAAQLGMIGLLAQGPAVPSAPFADPWAHGWDALAANGALAGDLSGAAGGVYALGLTGIGEGGGGRGDGIGLGTIGTLGHSDGRTGPGTGGDGSPQSGGGWSGDRGLTGHHTSRPVVCGCGGTMVSGRLPPETIRRIVRQNFGRFRACYESGLRASPNLAGRVAVSFVIGRDGAVASAADGGSDLPDPAVSSCVVRAFSNLSFPQPEGGIVTVSYPIQFSPE